MNFNNTLILGPLNDPCDRISDFSECTKSVGIVQDVMLVIFMLLTSYIVVKTIREIYFEDKVVSQTYKRFWIIAYISVIITLFDTRIIQMFAQPYNVEHNETYHSAIMNFSEKAHYYTAYVYPYYTGYVCFYLYDFLFLFIMSTVNNVLMVVGKKIAKIFDFILKIFYFAYTIIVLGCVLFTIRSMEDVCGVKWLTFAYNFNFVIHPSILALFYLISAVAFVFTKEISMLVPNSLQLLMKLMIFFIMFLTFIQTAFAIFRFHFVPNAFAVWASFDYDKNRFSYLNVILSYDFLVFIFPLMCLVTMMMIMSKININSGQSTDDIQTSLEKELVIEM